MLPCVTVVLGAGWVLIVITGVGGLGMVSITAADDGDVAFAFAAERT